VQIDIFEESGILNLNIADDGIGFDLNKKSKGIGLRNMQSRIDFYGGQFDIRSSEGNGCQLEIKIPLQVVVPVA
jgi:signal transduction histidine kinase